MCRSACRDAGTSSSVRASASTIASSRRNSETSVVADIALISIASRSAGSCPAAVIRPPAASVATVAAIATTGGCPGRC